MADWLAEIVSTGAPLPTFTTIEEGAEDWASWASLAELRAYRRDIDRTLGGTHKGRAELRQRLVDTWEALPAADRRAFAARIEGRAS